MGNFRAEAASDRFAWGLTAAQLAWASDFA